MKTCRGQTLCICPEYSMDPCNFGVLLTHCNKVTSIGMPSIWRCQDLMMSLNSDRCAELEGNLPLWLFCHSWAAFMSRIAAVTSVLVIDKLPVSKHEKQTCRASASVAEGLLSS